MSRLRGVLSSVLATASLCGCSTAWSDTPGWVDEILAADPVFGSGAALELRLRTDPVLKAGGDPMQRERFLRERRAEHDAAAIALIRTQVPESTARAVLPFLRGADAQAFVAVEQAMLAQSGDFGDDFPRVSARALGAREQVGEPARARLLQAFAALNGGASVSPQQLVSAIGQARIAPAQADAITAFFSSAAGRDWLEIRASAFPVVQQRYRQFAREACELGHFAATLSTDFEALILPDALPPDRMRR